jgi:hypothetical protein
MKLLKLENEVEMRSCDLFSCILFIERLIKIAKIPSRLTDSWGSGVTSRQMAPEYEPTNMGTNFNSGLPEGCDYVTVTEMASRAFYYVVDSVCERVLQSS